MIESNNIRRIIVLLSIGMIILGLLLSRSMISIGMGFLTANAIINPNWKENLGRLIRYTPYLVLPGLAILYFSSGLWSDYHLEFFWERSRLKIPFIIMPIAFAGITDIKRQDFYGILAFFVSIVAISAIGVLGNYLMDYEKITDSYIHAKVIPTPVNHIRYSLMCAFAALTGWVLWRVRFSLKFKWESILYLGISIFFFAFLHILSVRSGVLALYLAIMVLGIRHAIIHRQWKIGLGVILGVIAIPMLSYLFIPTFKNKIDYMISDLKMYREGETIHQLSDTRRLTSFKAGIWVGKQSPVIGTGLGDFRKDIHKYYAEFYPETAWENQLLPHNQFIYFFGCTGIIGLLISLGILLWPLLYRQNYLDPLFLGFHAITFSSFMTEATLEIQIGTAFYLCFLLLIMRYLEDHPPQIRMA